jgi:Na+-transporting methylmalonyl-CoA/oxaloacetate decarboxylase beta subunit
MTDFSSLLARPKLMHAMACNSSGVIGSAVCAGILWSFML